MYTRNKIALMIENKIGYTNGWRVDDETYERECLMIADELIKLFSIPIVVGRSEQLPSCDKCGYYIHPENKTCLREGCENY